MGVGGQETKGEHSRKRKVWAPSAPRNSGGRREMKSRRHEVAFELIMKYILQLSVQKKEKGQESNVAKSQYIQQCKQKAFKNIQRAPEEEEEQGRDECKQRQIRGIMRGAKQESLHTSNGGDYARSQQRDFPITGTGNGR